MKQKTLEVMISEQEIQEKIKELGKAITNDYSKDNEVVVIGVLKGACVFLSDLIRQMKIDNVYIDFMSVSSYGMSTESSGVVRILKDLDLEIEGKHVLIVEDIIDTGLTLQYLTKNLQTRNIKSLKICTLLDKPSRRKCELNIDYSGFIIPDKFIVGYGIDYAEKYRNLPYIASVE
ncbi:hypoxanthine phosphoribosyltransferase [Serpentinicella alkaliphila]|uniref:Hypoxanthine phosphoribosyltransferase n=1 Tax=Serpentinicella alkaliphila TaxID=1734049 RepID=A0A4V2T587_9FIRM|nr:hypoxanthine phosphoribosyltransferase [Serpentinicella alkaliphila]QUH26794.1 hypoxanthine phosphoribosyltransferase [Serpentinicella alkaliphila]TCQ08014.1 hypoxanthine phosphoribosyltransferase [Serpentinicella alkaliphila]